MITDTFFCTYSAKNHWQCNLKGFAFPIRVWYFCASHISLCVHVHVCRQERELRMLPGALGHIGAPGRNTDKKLLGLSLHADDEAGQMIEHCKWEFLVTVRLC